MISRPVLLSLAVASMISGAIGARAQQPTPVTHASDLSSPRIDKLADGRVVITSEAGGDLKGSVTFTLTPRANGSYSGEWAFAVANADTTDPATGIDPEAQELATDGRVHDDDEAPAHKGFLRLVNRGSLNGAIADATISFGPDGGVTGVSATLSIDQGASEFKGATGSGSATLTQLTLTF